MRESLSRIKTLTLRNIKEILRDPLSLIFMIALPLFMEILFYYLFHGMTDQFDMKYLAPGIVVFSQSFLSLFTGLLIAIDRSSSFLTRLYVSKAKPFEFISGYMLAMIPLTFFQSILFFTVGGIIDPSIFGAGMILSILISLVTSLLFISFGVLFGSICNEKSIGGIASIVITCQSVLSGMWFPTEGMKGGFMTLMKILPFRNASLAAQYALTGSGGVLLPTLIVLGYTAVIFALSVFLFGKKMNAD